jgi:hypothetical protein
MENKMNAMQHTGTHTTQSQVWLKIVDPLQENEFQITFLNPDNV